MQIEKLARLLEPYQIEKLLEIVTDFHWMARRYADGRMSYATSLFNDHTRVLQSMDIELNPTADGVLFAQDGMGRPFDGLTDDQARLAQINAADVQLAELFAHYQERQQILLPDWLQKAYEEWKEARGYDKES